MSEQLYLPFGLEGVGGPGGHVGPSTTIARDFSAITFGRGAGRRSRRRGPDETRPVRGALLGVKYLA